MTTTDLPIFNQRTVATLSAPWSMTFLPDGNMLVTERPPGGETATNPKEGDIRLVTAAGVVSQPLAGVPDNVGVLDIKLDPHFEQNHLVYFSYLESDPTAPRVGRNAGDASVQPVGVAVARGVLDLSHAGSPQLTATSVIWEQVPKIVSNPGSGEPGGRLAFSPDGTYLFITAGDRQEFGPVQSLENTIGKTVRIYPDGSIPADNPYVNVEGARPDIWTLGHRNPYGLVFDANGVLWENEMGPKGGDELNVIRPGANYGWPNVSYGNNYDGSLLPKPAPGDGFDPAPLQWTPVIAPSGMVSYSGSAISAWTGDLVISGLQSHGLVIVDTDGTAATEVGRLTLGARTRDVVQGPDGSLWVLYDQPDGRLVQLTSASDAVVTSAATGMTFIGNMSANVIQGGAGNDTIMGGAGADMLSGGAGADVFRDTAADHDGDTITDFGLHDQIVFSDADSASFSFSLNGTTLDYTGGSLSLQTISGGYHFVRNLAAGGEVSLTLAANGSNPISGDYNGDGRDDILWRRDDGPIGDWLGQVSGGFATNEAGIVAVSNDWQIVGAGDFNGDGRDDILWRSSDGRVGDWYGQTDGNFVANNAGIVAAPTDWSVAGAGDFNGDGRDDILWRNRDGLVGDWLGQTNGSFTVNEPAIVAAPKDWNIIGTGDFNGDGRDDILWRSADGQVDDWLGQTNGGFAANAAGLVAVSMDWKIVGTGDFDGNGKDDILWRNDNGLITAWLGQADGGFVNDSNAVLPASGDWNVAGTGDFNGDGRSDILWRQNDGRVGQWFGQADGSFLISGVFTDASNNWHIQAAGDHA